MKVHMDDIGSKKEGDAPNWTWMVGVREAF